MNQQPPDQSGSRIQQRFNQFQQEVALFTFLEDRETKTRSPAFPIFLSFVSFCNFVILTEEIIAHTRLGHKL